jgi:glycosyl transferase family 25
MTRVISLPRDVDRRARFELDAAATTLPWAYFDAVTTLSEDLEYDPALAFRRRGRALSGLELACYSSHYAVWQEFLRSQHQQLLVFEDDTWVDWPLVEQIARHDFSSIGIDYLRLNALNLPPTRVLGKVLGRYVVHYLGYPQGAQGYLLTRAGAATLLLHCRRVAGPIDIVMDQTWWGGLPSLGVFPYPVVERTGRSSIGRDRFGFVLPDQKRLFWPRQLTRAAEFARLRLYRIASRCGLGPRPNLDRRWL